MLYFFETTMLSERDEHALIISITVIISILLFVIAGLFILHYRQRKIYQKLQESEQRFKSIADYIVDWEYWRLPNGKYEYISKGCKEISGYERDEFYENPSLFNNIVIPEDKEIIERHVQEELINNYKETTLIFRIKTKQGEIKWLKHICRPAFNTEGVYIGRRGVNHDITEEKELYLALNESDKNLNEIYNSSSDAIFICNLYGEIQDCNRTATNKTEYNKDEIIGKNIKLISTDVNEVTPDIVDKKLNQYLQAGNTILGANLKTKSGKISPIETEHRIISYKGKKAFMLAVKDVSDKINTQHQLLKAIIETENKERERFARDIHDTTGSLLSSLSIYLNLVEQEKNENQRKTYINSCNALLISAIKNTKEIALNIKPSSLSNFGFIESINKFCNKISQTSTLHFNLDISNIEGLLNEEIEVELFKIINELINNTIKYASAQNVSISIYEENETIMLKYSDDGIGCDIEKSYTKEKSLGLKNIQHRVKSLNGDCAFESGNKKGFTAEICI